MLLALIVIAIAIDARAASGNSATAQTLFDEARALMRDGKYDQACPKLEESQRLDPALGTSMNLADCWEQLGRTASAWSKFVEVADAALAAGLPDHQRVARQRAERLVPKLSKLIVSVPDAHRLPGLEVRRDGILVGPAQLETPVPLDPGLHRVEARAPGRATWRTEIRIGVQPEERRVVVPLLRNLPPPGGRRHEPDAGRAWMKPGGLMSVGLGVAGLGVGTYFGLRALALHDESEQQGCDENDVCEPKALETRERAIRAGNVSTVLFVAGGALVTGGVVLYLFGNSSSTEPRVTATLGPRSVLAVSGSF